MEGFRRREQRLQQQGQTPRIFNGCRLWRRCNYGTSCRPDSPRPFLTDARQPTGMPDGSFERRTTTRCPLEHCGPRVWATIDQWSAWSGLGRVGLPYPGHLDDQPAWELDAIRVLDAEERVIDAYLDERRAAERKAGAKGRR